MDMIEVLKKPELICVKEKRLELANAILMLLNRLSMDIPTLRSTGIGKSVNRLCKDEEPSIKAKAEKLVKKWKQQATEGLTVKTIPDKMVDLKKDNNTVKLSDKVVVDQQKDEPLVDKTVVARANKQDIVEDNSTDIPRRVSSSKTFDEDIVLTRENSFDKIKEIERIKYKKVRGDDEKSSETS